MIYLHKVMSHFTELIPAMILKKKLKLGISMQELNACIFSLNPWSKKCDCKNLFCEHI